MPAPLLPPAKRDTLDLGACSPSRAVVGICRRARVRATARMVSCRYCGREISGRGTNRRAQQTGARIGVVAVGEARPIDDGLCALWPPYGLVERDRPSSRLVGRDAGEPFPASRHSEGERHALLGHLDCLRRRKRAHWRGPELHEGDVADRRVLDSAPPRDLRDVAGEAEAQRVAAGRPEAGALLPPVARITLGAHLRKGHPARRADPRTDDPVADLVRGPGKETYRELPSLEAEAHAGLRVDAALRGVLRGRRAGRLSAAVSAILLGGCHDRRSPVRVGLAPSKASKWGETFPTRAARNSQ
jgi:hypothetical protein